MQPWISKAIVSLTTLSFLVSAFSGCRGDSAHADETEISQSLILISPDGPSRLSLRGETSDFGSYVANGELFLTPGTEEGSFSGVGVAAFQAEDGEQIVADVTATIREGSGNDLSFHWRDGIIFHDGLAAGSTGHFIESKPPGLQIFFNCSTRCFRICFSDTVTTNFTTHPPTTTVTPGHCENRCSTRCDTANISDSR